jgi:protoporphyrinogen/coproporphyrinogen III oxidase
MHVVVIGAGITGLIAARRLVAAGVDVTVLERSDRLGGQLHTQLVGGRPVDLGAEALVTGMPGSLTLIDELGLADEVVFAERGTTWIWTARGLRPLPEGFGPAGPTRLWPMLTSRMLSPTGALRAGMEPFVPRGRNGEDEAVGRFLDRRFGRQVTDRLVDPLLGGLHSGDVRRLSLQAATPQLAALTARHRSLLLRRRNGSARHGFATIRGGMARLVARLADDLQDPGGPADGDRRGAADLHLDVEVVAIARAGSRTVVATSDGVLCEADGVVLAAPAAAAAHLVGAASPQAAEPLGGFRAASVAVAVVSYPDDHVASLPAFEGTGMLVASGEGHLLKAATFVSSKWPHQADGAGFLVRLSAGRMGDERAQSLDDDTLVARLHGELARATGLRAEPELAHVHRWTRTMPQLEVGHRERLDAARAALARDLPGVVLAGAAYDGPGIAGCLRSGAAAADQVTSAARAST